MLGHLIRKEILDQILGLRFLILSGIGALVIWLSLYDGYAYYQEQLRDYRLGQATTENRLQQIMGAGNWSEISSRGYPVHRAPSPMSIFVRGMDATLGRSISVAGSVRSQRLRESPAAVEPMLGVFPPLDLGLVVQVVLSLFVLLFTYDGICGEKEAGTLRLTASFPVPRDRLLLGKLIGALMPALAAFGIPLLLGFAVVLAMPGVQFSLAELVRFALVAVAFGLYLTTFACAGLLASCMVHRAATSFVILLAFWAATVAVLPRLSLIAADAFRPAPSLHELQTKKEAFSTAALKRRYDLHRQWREAYKQKAGQESWETPEGREAYQLYFAQTRRDAWWEYRPAQDRLAEAFRNRYNARLNLAVTLARISPAFALNNATIRLAGTGYDPYQRFLEAFEVFMRHFWEWHADTKTRDRLKQVQPEKYGEYKWDVSDIPRFAFRETGSDDDVGTALVDVGVLAMWALVFFTGAYVAMLRYDLR